MSRMPLFCALRRVEYGSSRKAARLKRQLSKDLCRPRALYRRRILAKFPQELLREIFIHYSNDASSDWYNNNNWTALYFQPDYMHDWVTMPYRFATVCQKWRTVALDTGCLWTYITTFHGPESRNQPQVLSNIKRALTSIARSGSATLLVHCPGDSVHSTTTVLAVERSSKLYAISLERFNTLHIAWIES